MSKSRSALLKTLIFTILVPGSVTVVVPHFLLSDRGQFETGMLRLIGIPPIILGILIYLSCAWNFAFVGQGTPAIVDPPRLLVFRGLYRYVRNPMYIGVQFVLLGEAILFQSSRLFTYAVLLWMFFHLFVVYYEEPTLKKKFGVSYENYCTTVPRWIPRLHLKTKK